MQIYNAHSGQSVFKLYKNVPIRVQKNITKNYILNSLLYLILLEDNNYRFLAWFKSF